MCKIKYTLFNQVVIYATAKHAHQLRKGTPIPYITHPIAVAEILARYSAPPDVVYAALLHDVLEDTNTTQDELANLFGTRVAEIVAAVSEVKQEGSKDIPWADRKRAQIQHIEHADLEMAQLKAADVLHNISAIITDLKVFGDRIWLRFNASTGEQLGYYQALVQVLSNKLGDQDITTRISETLATLMALCPDTKVIPL